MQGTQKSQNHLEKEEQGEKIHTSQFQILLQNYRNQYSRAHSTDIGETHSSN